MISGEKKIIKIKLEKEQSLFQQINNRIIKDFNIFKKLNNLSFCGCKQSPPRGNEIEVVWSTTIKYKNSLVDIDTVVNDFKDFSNANRDEYCTITKMTCQENIYIAEFSIVRVYTIEQ